VRSEDARTTFAKVQAGLKGFENSVQHLGNIVRREFGSLLRLTGAGGLLGGGLVAGLAQTSQALGGLARSSLQTSYTAEALGLTGERLNRLTARGMALGQTQKEAETNVKAVLDHLHNMRTYGTNSSEWQELLKGRGGAQLARELMAAFEKSPEAALEYLAGRRSTMKELSGSRSLDQIFSLPLGFKDQFKIQQSELGEIFQLSEPEARRFAVSMAQLNISFQNIKLQAAQAFMPMFERMASGFATFLQGPGGKIAKEFGDWLKNLDIPWDKIATGIVKILNALANFFKGMGEFIKEMDPIVKQMDGWKVIIGGLAVVLGTAGLAGWLGSVSAGLGLIANAAWILPLVGAAALSAGTGAGAAETGPTEGAGKGKRLDRPPPPMAPRSPTGPQPGPSAPAPPPMQRRSSLDPETAAPYRVAGGWQPPPQSSYREETAAHDTGELREQVKAVKTEVVRLAGYIEGLGLTTDATGAGGLAGFRGVLGRLSAPMGGAPGGGGGGGRDGGRRAPRGGGRGGDVRPRGPATTYQQSAADTEAIVKERTPFIEQLKDPETRSLAAWAMRQEHHDPSKRSDPLEALINRAVADNARRRAEGLPPKTIKQFLTDGFYGPVNDYRKRHGQLPGASDQQLRDFDEAEKEVAAGSNRVRGRTDQGMAHEHKADPGGKFPVRGEYYSWHRGGTRYEKGTAAARAAPGQDVAAPQAVPPAAQTQQPGRPDAPPPLQGRTAALKQVDARLVEIVSAAQTHLPPGYTVRVTAGYNPQHGSAGSQHRRGGAIDVQIFGPDGNPIPNRGGDHTGIYRTFARHAYGEMLVRYPELQGRLAWGGSFGTSSRNPNEPDLMHIDIGGERGRLAPHLSKMGAVAGTKYGQGVQTAEREPSPILFSTEPELIRQREFATRARTGRINLNIRVRGPRGVKTAASSTGALSSPTISREMDPTGGGQIESPA
jgi:hypothetical protein